MTVQDKTFTQEISDVCLKYFWLKKRRRKKDHIWAQIHISAVNSDVFSLNYSTFLQAYKQKHYPRSKDENNYSFISDENK